MTNIPIRNCMTRSFMVILGKTRVQAEPWRVRSALLALNSGAARPPRRGRTGGPGGRVVLQAFGGAVVDHLGLVGPSRASG